MRVAFELLYRFVGTKVKYLTKGVAKRLSIAEEIVHGPVCKLLLLDEPTKTSTKTEVATLLSILRELVNLDYTIVASMERPSAEAFQAFDSLLLLSKGKVLYTGRVSSSTEFFVKNSVNKFDQSNHSNPADFLLDIASGSITDTKVSAC